MSKVEELLAKYNSNGISTIKLADILDYEQPSKYIVSSSEYDDNYDIPVLTAGQSFILGYTDEKDGVYKASKNNPTIIFDDFTTGHHWVDFDFKIKSSAMKMLRLKNNKSLLRYIFHSMALINYVPTEHSRQWISKYSQFEIPLPHIKVQEEIVNILDSFTNLIDALNEELSLRQKQFEYYREKLLTFDEEPTSIFKFTKVLRGKRLTTKELSDNAKYPVYHGGTEPIGYYNEYNRDENTVMVINVGASAGTIGFCNQAFWSSDGCYCLSHNQKIDNKFLYYSLLIREYKIKSQVRYAGIPTLDQKVIENIQLFIPSLAIQQSIVEKLDAFESLISSLKEEIALRQKQYEYYREKLLTFN